MPFSSTNYVDFSYIKETVSGETPDNPQFQKLPITSVGLSDNITTAVSEVIRSDRQTDDLVLVDSEITGDCNFELSYEPYKPLLISLLQSTNLVTVNTAITGCTSPNLIDGSNFNASGIVNDMFIRVTGMTNDENNNIFKIVSFNDNQITVDTTTLITEVTAGTIDCEMLRNGADTPDRYTMRKQFNPPGGTDAIMYYRGCIIGAMTMDFETGSILTGVNTFTGMTNEARTTNLPGEQTPLEVANYRIMNSVSSITKVDISGLPADTSFSTLNLTIDNQVTPAKAIGTLGAADLASFSLMVTADIEMYFSDLSIYDIYKNASEFALSFTLDDNPVFDENGIQTSSGNIIVVSMPKCKFEELEQPIDSKDEFLMENGSLRALRDATNDYMIQFCFFDDV